MIQELRIGNIVRLNNPEGQREFTGRYCRVEGIQANHVNGPVVWLKVIGELILAEKCVSDLCQFIKYVEPIPITEELLEKCGFVEEFKGKLELGNEYGVTFLYKDGILTMYNEYSEFGNEIKYLHTLQNVYYFTTLTGTELEVKL